MKGFHTKIRMRKAAMIAKSVRRWATSPVAARDQPVPTRVQKAARPRQRGSGAGPRSSAGA
jgi:hypothetical protein